MEKENFTPLGEYYKQALERYRKVEADRTSAFYAVVPVFILENKRLTAMEKLLYGEISSLVNKHGYCYATNEHFKETLNCGIATIKRGLKKLTELDFIRVEVEKTEKGTWRKLWINC